MDKDFARLLQNTLLWLPEYGYGYLKPNVNFKYDNNYIDKFKQYEKLERTVHLNNLRVNLVNEYIGKEGWLLDFGCGCGTFIKQRGDNTFGYDVALETCMWLRENKLEFDPICSTFIDNICFWDSLEHVNEPDSILNQILNYAFISMPVYKNGESVLKSKHYKPNEHIYYFTIEGLIRFMEMKHFTCVKHLDLEGQIGREEIETFVFRRNGKEHA